MDLLNAIGRRNLAQIFAGAVNAGAKLENVDLRGFISDEGDEAEEYGQMMLESMLSAELSGLISLNLSAN